MFGDGSEDVNGEFVRLRKVNSENSTLLSIRFATKATLRARRSSLAMTKVA